MAAKPSDIAQDSLLPDELPECILYCFPGLEEMRCHEQQFLRDLDAEGDTAAASRNDAKIANSPQSKGQLGSFTAGDMNSLTFKWQNPTSGGVRMRYASDVSSSLPEKRHACIPLRYEAASMSVAEKHCSGGAQEAESV